MEEENKDNDIQFRIEEAKVRERLRKLLKLAIDIGRREGLIGTGMTLEQVREEIELRKMQSNSRTYSPIFSPAQVESAEMTGPVIKEIRVRLPIHQWELIGKEARKLRISHSELSLKWILEGLDRSRSDFIS